MDNSLTLMDMINNEEEYIAFTKKLKKIHQEIIRLIIQKEEYELMIEEYLRSKESWTSRINIHTW